MKSGVNASNKKIRSGSILAVLIGNYLFAWIHSYDMLVMPERKELIAKSKTTGTPPYDQYSN